jgi:large subunit ribosomal protein L9
MKVILVERLKGVGEIGEVVQVKDGYARNFLLPQKKAMAANEANLATIESQRGALEAQEKQRHDDALVRVESLAGVVVVAACKASDEGKLYGALSVGRIVELLAEKGFEVTAQEVVMPASQVRHIGDYMVVLSLYKDVSCEITLQVVSEDA